MRNKRFKAIAIAAITALTMLATPFSAMAAMTTIPNDTKGKITIHKFDTKVWEDEKSPLYGQSQDHLKTGESDEKLNKASAAYGIKDVEFTQIFLGRLDTYQYKDVTKNNVLATGIAYEVPDQIAKIIFGDTYAESAITNADELVPNAGKKYYKASELTRATSGMTPTKKNQLKEYIESEAGKKLLTQVPATTSDNGLATFEGLLNGLYLIDESKVPANVVRAEGPFFVSVPMTNKDGDSWNYDIHVYPKNKTEKATVDKVVRRENDLANITFQDSTTAAINETVNYRIRTQIPEITVGQENSKLTGWKYTDKLEESLDYVVDDNQIPKVTVKIYDADVEIQSLLKKDLPDVAEKVTTLDTDDYTVVPSADGRSFTVQFSQRMLDKMNTTKPVGAKEDELVQSVYTGKQVVVCYSAKVNSKAILGSVGNDNEVTFEYKRSDKSEKETDIARVFVYGLSLEKRFSEVVDQTDKNWQQVKFTLQNEAGDFIYLSEPYGETGIRKVAGTTEGYKWSEKDQKWISTKNGQDELSIKDNQWHISPLQSGKCEIEGIAAGTYKLTETHTAPGYSLLKNSITIIITRGTKGEDNRATAKVYDNDAKVKVNIHDVDMTSFKYVDEDKQSQESRAAIVPLEIVNTKTWIPNLPHTGGLGTALIVILGAVVAGAGIYVTTSKKKAK